jgi:hypothetical protein|tara:strand:+ start:671 stop:850 length:180 start_codon:yes stop_codon:yes gene_type:complete
MEVTIMVMNKFNVSMALLIPYNILAYVYDCPIGLVIGLVLMVGVLFAFNSDDDNDEKFE